MQSMTRAIAMATFRNQPFVHDLAGGFASALLDRKAGYRCNAIPRRLKRVKRLVQSETERANHPCSDDSNARGRSFSVISVRYHDFSLPQPLDLLLLSETKHLTKEPERGKQQLVSWWIVS
jgi:hypothetical protein